MTPEQAIETLEDSLSEWSTWAMEDHPRSSEPLEIEALGRARDALDVLRLLHINELEEAA